jgi:dephospho-CoA kinase
MRTVGLTGGIACGKSTVADILRRRGLPVIDADLVAREVVAAGTPGLALVLGRFPAVARNGAIDRAALRDLVSRSAEARRDLEAILHPLIGARILEALADLAKADAPLAFVEAALMIETGSYRRYDAVVVVVASPEVQLRRLMARDGMGEQDARRFIATQMPIEEKEKVATVVIENSGDLGALEVEVDRMVGALGLDRTAEDAKDAED